MSDRAKIRDRLYAVHRRSRRATRWSGGALLAAGLGTALAAVAGLDWLVVLPPAVRALALFGLGLGLQAGLARWRDRLRQETWDELAVARRVEVLVPHLRERLVSAVQSPGDGRSEGAPDGALWRALVTRAAQDIDRLTAGQTLNTRTVRRALLLAGAVAVVLTAAGVLAPHVAQTALTRLLLPFGRSPWTVIADRSPGFVAVGGPFEIRAELYGVAPRVARLVWYEDEAEHRQTVPVLHDAQTGSAWVIVTVPAVGAFRYELSAYDSRVQRAVPVARSPELLPDSPCIAWEPPPYTGLPPGSTDGGKDVEVVRGAVVRLYGQVDGPLRAARLQVDSARPPSTPPPAGEPPPRAAATAREAVLGQDLRSFHFAVETWSLEPGHYALVLDLEDGHGLHTVRRLSLRVSADPPPAAAIMLLGESRPAVTVLPTTPVALTTAGLDPAYGLRSLALRYHRRGDFADARLRVARAAAVEAACRLGNPGTPLAAAAEFHHWHEIGLAEPRLDVLWPAAVIAGQAGPGPNGWVGLGAAWRTPAPARWTLTTICRPADWGLTPGDTLVVEAVATDSNPSPPGRTTTAPVEIHVIGAAELDQQIAAALTQITERLDSWRRELVQLTKELSPAVPASTDAAERLRHLARRMDQAAWASDLARPRQLLRDNGLWRPDLEQRADAAAAEAGRIRDELLLPAAAMLLAAPAPASALGPSSPPGPLPLLARAADDLQVLRDFWQEAARTDRARADLRGLLERQQVLLRQTRSAGDDVGDLAERQARLAEDSEAVTEGWLASASSRELELLARAAELGAVDALTRAATELAGGRPRRAAAWQRQAVAALHDLLLHLQLATQREVERTLDRERALGDDLAQAEALAAAGDEEALAALRRRIDQAGLGPVGLAVKRLLDQAVGPDGEARTEALRRARGLLDDDRLARAQALALDRLETLEREARGLERVIQAMTDAGQSRSQTSRDLALERQAAADALSATAERLGGLPQVGLDHPALVDGLTALAREFRRAAAVWPVVAGESQTETLGRLLDRLRGRISLLEELRRRLPEPGPTGDSSPGKFLRLGPPGPSSPAARAAEDEPAGWDRLPPRVRQELEEYAKDQFLPKYREEGERYLRAVTGQRGRVPQ